MNRINPFRLFVGSFVPNWLMERKEVSAGAKLLYARLCQYAGRDGHCFPSQTALAEALGMGERQIRNLVAELKGHGLIETQQPGLSRPLHYFFNRHPWMSAPGPEGFPEEEPQQSAALERNPVAGLERNSIAGQDRQSSSAPLLFEENQEKRTIGSESGAEAAELLPEIQDVTREEILTEWQSLPSPFPRVKFWTGKKRTALCARMKDRAWRENWREAMRRMPSCPFLRGENPRQWVADLEFFLRPDSVAKILEGKYDAKKEAPKQLWQKL